MVRAESMEAYVVRFYVVKAKYTGIVSIMCNLPKSTEKTSLA